MLKKNDENNYNKSGQLMDVQKRKPLIERLGLVEPDTKESKIPVKIVKESIDEKNEELENESNLLRAEKAAEEIGLGSIIRSIDSSVAVVNEVKSSVDMKINSEIQKEEIAAVEQIIIDRYDEKKSVKEIYEGMRIDMSDIGTIYMVENFINALPATLPQDVRRASLVALMQASHLDMKKLMGDGDERINALMEYKNRFEESIAAGVADNEKEIARLNDEIANHKKNIEEKLALKEAQHFEIEFEVQRLMNIIGFVKNDK